MSQSASWEGRLYFYLRIWYRQYCHTSDAASSHALVSFLDEDQLRLADSQTEGLPVGVECGVKWSDGNVYRAKVLAVGECHTVLMLHQLE